MLRIPNTLNGYKVIHSYTGPTLGVVLVEDYLNDQSYVVASVTEDSLKMDEWLGGTYTHEWDRAVKVFQSKVIDFMG